MFGVLFSDLKGAGRLPSNAGKILLKGTIPACAAAALNIVYVNFPPELRAREL